MCGGLLRCLGQHDLVLLVLFVRWAVEHEFRADDLHLLAARQGAQLVARLARGEHAVFKHAALDELTRLQRVVRLLDEVVADAVLADVNDHVEVIGKAAQIRALFAA